MSESEGVESIKNVGGMLARCEEGLVCGLSHQWASKGGGDERWMGHV